MRVSLGILLTLLFPVLVHAECEELVELRKSSQAALRGYAERLINVDPKFEGVVGFGRTLRSIRDPATVNVGQITVANKDYWRAVLEMVPADPSILFAHAHLHAARGETAYAEIYFLLGGLTMNAGFRRVLRLLPKGVKKPSCTPLRPMHDGSSCNLTQRTEIIICGHFSISFQNAAARKPTSSAVNLYLRNPLRTKP